MEKEDRREKKPKVGLWDFTGVLYSVSFIKKEESDNLRDYTEAIDEIIYNVCIKLELDSIVLALDEGKTFRHKLNPNYKANRPSLYVKFLSDLKHYVKEKYSALTIPQWEADDIVSYLAEIYREENVYEPIIIGTDKDLLQIEGTHYNPKTAITEHVDKKKAELNVFLAQF
jgi:5'-3' exonuclease